MSIVPTANQPNTINLNTTTTGISTANAANAAINNSLILNSSSQQQQQQQQQSNNTTNIISTSSNQSTPNVDTKTFSNLNVSALSSSTILNPLSIANSSSPTQTSTVALAKKSAMSSSSLSNAQHANSIATLASNVSMSSSVSTAASSLGAVASFNEVGKNSTSTLMPSSSLSLSSYSPSSSLPIAQNSTIGGGESQAQPPSVSVTPVQPTTVPNNPLVYDDISIFMWSVCKICNKSTKRQVMSPDTWSFSLAKFLELTFHSNAYKQFNEEATTTTNNAAYCCTHSLLQDHYQYFRFKNVVTVFSLSKININSLNLPNIVLKTNVI
jgi:hypothetical protein